MGQHMAGVADKHWAARREPSGLSARGEQVFHQYF